MSNLITLTADLNAAASRLEAQYFCECECCAYGQMNWNKIRELENEVASLERELALEQAAEAEALWYEQLEAAA